MALRLKSDILRKNPPIVKFLLTYFLRELEFRTPFVPYSLIAQYIDRAMDLKHLKETD